MLKELYYISEASLDVLKVELICYGGLRFPHRAMVLLVLVSDDTCTS
jgi:hypothetical protein